MDQPGLDLAQPPVVSTTFDPAIRRIPAFSRRPRANRAQLYGFIVVAMVLTRPTIWVDVGPASISSVQIGGHDHAMDGRGSHRRTRICLRQCACPFHFSATGEARDLFVGSGCLFCFQDLDSEHPEP